MADPIIPGGLRVQFVLRGRTGLPEDKYVTTWAFQTIDGLPPTVGQNVAAKDLVAEFFTGVTAPQTQSVRSLLGGQVDQPLTEARVYRLGDSIPRQPTIYPINLGTITATSLPSEVAVVASFFSTRNLPRRRGRVYIGPLASTAMATATNGVNTPALVIRTALLESMRRLRSAAPAQGLNWSVLSQVDAVMRPITAGWVDDAWDTQRRRGEGATGRLTWAQVGT
jgi:hypothetical protein